MNLSGRSTPWMSSSRIYNSRFRSVYDTTNSNQQSKNQSPDNSAVLSDRVAAYFRKKVRNLEKEKEKKAKLTKDFTSGENYEVVTAQQQMSLLPGLPLENLKIFSLFKVPMSKFKQIPTFDARIEFLIEHMANNIREQLRNLNGQAGETRQ